MSYSLNNIAQIDGLLFDRENKGALAQSLNLKYNLWKHKNEINYHILKYDKKFLSKDIIHSTGLLRSLIFKDDGTVVCFAPPKSFSNDTLNIDSNIDSNINYRAEQFIEGTMINVFYDKESANWEIATKSTIGGELCFFTEGGFNEINTFNYMFNEVCNHIGFNINDLNKEYSYSFVFQHPRNRIVKYIKKMKLYLVEVYQIIDNKMKTLKNVRSYVHQVIVIMI